MSDYQSATPTLPGEEKEINVDDTFFFHRGSAAGANNLLACLALYQYRQDKAVGINWLSFKTRDLLWYYNQLQQQQLSTLMTAAYLNGIIQQGAKEIKELVKKAEKTENKQEVLEYAWKLQSEIEQAKKKLDEIE